METYSSKLLSELLDAIPTIEQAKTDAKMLIAAKIADAMQAKGWKHKDLLEVLGKTNASIITKWLSGTHNFTVDTIVELEQALDIQILNLEAERLTEQQSVHIIVEVQSTKDEGQFLDLNKIIGPNNFYSFTDGKILMNFHNSTLA
jgi:transcriptional regulator with XRE-family HTH domain